MFLEFLPDAVQQIAIAWFLLFCAYKFGERKKGKNGCDLFYRKLVRANAVAVAILYAEAIFLETLVMESEDLVPADLRDENDNKTEQWLKQHNSFFWFVLAIHQTLSLAIICYELMSEKKVMRLIWLGILPPFLQWHIGLFAKDPIAGAVTGLIFESVTPLLFAIYAIKICFSEHKKRASYGFCAIVSYLASSLPVLFLGTQMASPHHALYLTVFFGVISFFCWARTVVATPLKVNELGFDSFTRVHVEPPKPTKLEEQDNSRFSIDDEESKDTKV